MTLDRDGVMLPRLRPTDVARRGVAFGLLGVVPLMVATLSISGHSDRKEFLSVVGAFAGLFGVSLIVVGAGFWWASAGDIRRVRDWRTLTSQAASVTVVGPAFLRSGLFLSVLGAAALGLYQLVDTAPYGSWLRGQHLPDRVTRIENQIDNRSEAQEAVPPADEPQYGRAPDT